MAASLSRDVRHLSKKLRGRSAPKGRPKPVPMGGNRRSLFVSYSFASVLERGFIPHAVE